MDTSSVVEPYLILVGTLLIPAVVFFIVFTAIRLHRAKFRRQRIHRGGSSSRHED